jgi:hypothetical protein
MEFKGTKGKWKLEERYNAFYINRNIDSLDIHIKDRNYDIAKHDALLISKSPEMLEMLNKILGQTDPHSNSHLYYDIEKLIKEATEL